MEINTMNNGYGYGMYDSNPYFQQQPFQQQPMQVPQMQNALTNEEIQRLRSLRPTTSLNLSVDQEEVLRAMCTHKDNGREVVQLLQDGSGDAYCPICGKRWKPEQLSQEDLQALVDQLICQMQNAKWVGELPANVVREFFAMMPLIEKFPELYRYSMKNFNKYANQSGMFNAADASIYAMYNGLFSGAGAYAANPYQQAMNGYYQQPMGMGYYQQPMQQQAPQQAANPNVNPMQQPQQPYNAQFTNQANMMMGGTMYQQQPMGMGYYQQPMQQAPQQMPQANTYTFGVAQQQMAQQQPTTDQKPAQQAATPADTKADL